MNEANATQNTHITQEHRTLCNRILNNIQMFGKVKKDFRSELQLFLKNHGQAHSNATMTNNLKRLPRDVTRTAYLQFIFMKDNLGKILEKHSNFYIRHRDFYHPYKELTELVKSLSNTNLYSISIEAFCKNVFNINSPDLEDIQPFIHQYIGYRLSSTRGKLIRFQLSINRLGGISHKFVSFQNFFSWETESWTTSGVGFSVGKILNLFGHARSSSSNNAGEGMGMRFFSLMRSTYAQGCLIGQLISVHHRAHTPIGAKIILIPAIYHSDFSSCATQIIDDNSVRNFVLKNQKEEGKPDHINTTLKSWKKATDHAPYDVIRYFVRNISFTTLRTDQENVPILSEFPDLLRQLWGYEENVSEIAGNMANFWPLWIDVLKKFPKNQKNDVL